MLTTEQLNIIYAEKLLKTGSHDAAMMKVCWVAYNAGIASVKTDEVKNKLPAPPEPAEPPPPRFSIDNGF